MARLITRNTCCRLKFERINWPYSGNAWLSHRGVPLGHLDDSLALIESQSLIGAHMTKAGLTTFDILALCGTSNKSAAPRWPEVLLQGCEAG